MKTLARVLLASAVFVLTASADLLSNGSFELPNIGNNFYATYYGGDSVGIPGWTVTGTSVDVVSVLGNNSYPAEAGNQSIDLAGTPGPGGVEQTFATIAGWSYNISFWVSGNGGPQALNVFWNDPTHTYAPVATFNTPAEPTWTQEQITLQATGSSSTVEFYTSNTSNQGPMLDNVSATAVPEPGSILLLGTLLVGVASLLKKRLA